MNILQLKDSQCIEGNKPPSENYNIYYCSAVDKLNQDRK